MMVRQPSESGFIIKSGSDLSRTGNENFFYMERRKIGNSDFPQSLNDVLGYSTPSDA